MPVPILFPFPFKALLHIFPIKMSSNSTVSTSTSTSSPAAAADSTSEFRARTPPYGDTAEAASASVAPSAPIKLYKTYDEMPIIRDNTDLLRGIYAFGFEKPSPIQQQAIVPMAEGRDMLGQAPSGTGKTGAFVTGGLSRLDTTRNEIQFVILVPVRELADQIAKVVLGIGESMKVRCYVATGGPPVREDMNVLQQQRGSPPHVPHVLVGTPGRLYDLLHRRAFSPETVRVLVMDEADQLLEPRFREQIHAILALKWPTSTQVGLFSATMIPELATVARTILQKDKVEILLEAEEVSLEGIKQWYVPVGREEDKLDTLCDLYDHLSIQQANIFVNTRGKALELADSMRRRGFDLDCTHGDMPVEERKARMEAFRSGKTRVLISTDMLGRGIDVQQVSIVINYELPLQRESYIHRIGRSGRFGRKGASINLVSDREMRAQAEIEAFYGKKVMPLPMDLNIF